MCDCMYCEPLSWLYLLSVSPLSVILLSCGDSSSFCMIGAQVILFFSRYRIWANNVSSESEIQLDNQTTFKWVHFWEVWDSYVLGLQCFGISLRREWVLFRITIHNTLSSNVITPVWFGWSCSGDLPSQEENQPSAETETQHRCVTLW